MPSNIIIPFLKQQGMELFNQPNVKGWIGGNHWLTSQIYLQRNNAIDFLINGQNILGRRNKNLEMNNNEIKNDIRKLKPNLVFNTNGNHQTIIQELSDRLLFSVEDSIQKDMETILKYDFNPKLL